MFRIVKSLLTIVAVAAIATSATGAYFTSEATISNVTVGTGTLEIKDNTAEWMQGVNFSGLKPGDLIRKWAVIKNTGTLDVGTLTVSAVVTSDPSNLLHQLTGWTYGTIAGTSDSPDGVQTGYNNDAAVLLNNANLLSSANPVLHPNEQTTVQVQFVVPDDLNQASYQGQTATFNLVFHAEQSHAPAVY